MTLEKLLNKLINLGRKPRNKKYKEDFDIQIDEGGVGVDNYRYYFSLRDLVSIESGLWQFVCKKELQMGLVSDIFESGVREITMGISDWNYRLMLSSTQKDIEKFLLDNIKLPDDQS